MMIGIHEPDGVRSMASTATIPITVSSEAEAFIAGLGMQAEFEVLLDHARQAIADLRAIEVTLDETPETGPPGVIIGAQRGDPWVEDDPTNRDWRRWLITTFPPEVCQHFVMMSDYPADGR